MTCSPDYAYGRDTTAQFVEYLKHFAPDVEIVGEAWPKLFQPDYTEVITKILQTKPQALYSCLWGGDLTSFIDQGNIYALFGQIEVFAVNMADYTALTVVKNLPKGIHSGNRYIKTFPRHAENAAWGDAYRAKYNEYPTNWSWENATAVHFLDAAAKKANSADGKKIAEALRGLTIKSPFGADGTVTMRAEDQTLIGYAIGWGTTIPSEPYVPEVKAATGSRSSSSRPSGRRARTTPDRRLTARGRRGERPPPAVCRASAGPPRSRCLLGSRCARQLPRPAPPASSRRPPAASSSACCCSWSRSG